MYCRYKIPDTRHVLQIQNTRYMYCWYKIQDTCTADTKYKIHVLQIQKYNVHVLQIQNTRYMYCIYKIQDTCTADTKYKVHVLQIQDTKFDTADTRCKKDYRPGQPSLSRQVVLQIYTATTLCAVSKDFIVCSYFGSHLGRHIEHLCYCASVVLITVVFIKCMLCRIFWYIELIFY